MSCSVTQNIPCHHTILNRQEAKLRLQHLIPGSEEHSKVQTALLQPSGLVTIDLPHLSYRINISSEERLIGGFGSSEHMAIGEGVKLQGLPDNLLFVKGVTPIHFQHIVALAGDFYGVAGEAISLPGGDNTAKTQRFQKAFDTLDKADSDQLRRIVVEIDQECHAVRHSSLPHHCYSQQMMEKNNAILKIKSDINDLLADNSDHFSTNAKDAYQIGHSLALRVAQEAGQKKDVEGLKHAYALDAFACHFLTDLFASGHIRNQRGDLELFLLNQLQFAPSLAKQLAGLLTGAQHEKDGNDGLNVTNKKGDQWRAYGDGNFFTPKNAENKNQAITATQQSADEIFLAFSNPSVPVISTVDQLIPLIGIFNPLPLYSVEGPQLFIYEGSNKVEIKTQAEYLDKGIAQALRYLPQNYINGFIDCAFPNIAIHPIISKVVLPQVERITGTVWHMIGISTYHQLAEHNQQLNEKVDELADMVKGTYENTKKILAKMGQISSQLNQMEWVSAFDEIKTAIDKIKDHLHAHKLFHSTLSDQQLQQAQNQLWDAYIRISRVFSEVNTSASINLLAHYQTLLKTTTQMTETEIKISTTLWFRQMLDYQVQAFCMYGIVCIQRDRTQEAVLRDQAIKVEANIMQQIELNKTLIDMDLIYEKPTYIALQLKKNKTANQWLKTLN